MPNKRDFRVDGIKLFLIVLVTLGHALESCISNPISNRLYSAIYLFHMPAFILVSGYFASVSSKDKLIKKAIAFIETFLVIMIPQCLFFGRITPLLNPENSGWYLLSMIFWYSIVCLLDKYSLIMRNVGGGKILIISIILSLIVFLLPLCMYGNLFSFQRTFMFLPYFIFGYILKKQGRSLIPKFTSRMRLLIGMGSIVSIVLCIVYSGRLLHVLEFNNANIWFISNLYEKDFLNLLLLKIAISMGAIITTAGVLLFIRLPKSISQLGSQTLVFYVVQGILVHIVARQFSLSFLLSVILSMISIIVSLLLIKSVNLKYITNPISSILKWKY